MRLQLVTWGLLALAGGCASKPYMTPERLDRGLVIVLPGIEGRGRFNEAICTGLDDGGVNWGIDLVDWTSPWGPILNLRAQETNREKARKIAVQVMEYKFAHPDNPVVLVGQSGGGAIALWIAEALPAGQKVDGLVLLAPAISPGYVLDFALEHTSRGIVNFYSAKDWLFLGVGTTVAGTMDAHHTSSAGRVGFQIRPDRPKLYDRLFQIAWHERMADAGYTGGHLSSAARTFVATYVAPLLHAGEWSEETVAAVLNRQKPPAASPGKWNEWKPMTQPAK